MIKASGLAEEKQRWIRMPSPPPRLTVVSQNTFCVPNGFSDGMYILAFVYPPYFVY